MRIYQRPFEAIKETERELFEMGIEAHPHTMQDKDVKDDPSYCTKEVRGYSFVIANWAWDEGEVDKVLQYFWPKEVDKIRAYIKQEFVDRISLPTNPGNSYTHRPELWDEYLHEGKFAYTYSERIAPQLATIVGELINNPETRQAIVTIHSNICPLDCWPEKTETNVVNRSMDLDNIGGGARVPCSMYYQVMIREGSVDLIYTMRSCDFLSHFPIDVLLALRLQNWLATYLIKDIGRFTYFVGSLHAYKKDMVIRGIF